MAALAGKKSNVTYKTKTLKTPAVGSWSINTQTDTLDVTGMTTGGVQWRSFLAGLSGWSGSISGEWNMIADTSGQKVMQTNTLTPATGTVKCFVSTTGLENYSGDVIFSGFSPSVDVGGTVKAVFNFTGNGALTYATA